MAKTISAYDNEVSDDLYVTRSGTGEKSLLEFFRIRTTEPPSSKETSSISLFMSLFTASS
jgi:hypothetical protein